VALQKSRLTKYVLNHREVGARGESPEIPTHYSPTFHQKQAGTLANPFAGFLGPGPRPTPAFWTISPAHPAH